MIRSYVIEESDQWLDIVSSQGCVVDKIKLGVDAMNDYEGDTWLKVNKLTLSTYNSIYGFWGSVDHLKVPDSTLLSRTLEDNIENTPRVIEIVELDEEIVPKCDHFIFGVGSRDLTLDLHCKKVTAKRVVAERTSGDRLILTMANKFDLDRTFEVSLQRTNVTRNGMNLTLEA